MVMLCHLERQLPMWNEDGASMRRRGYGTLHRLTGCAGLCKEWVRNCAYANITTNFPVDILQRRSVRPSFAVDGVHASSLESLSASYWMSRATPTRFGRNTESVRRMGKIDINVLALGAACMTEI